jgi:hypothetical protein
MAWFPFTALVHRREPERTETYPWRANDRYVERIGFSGLRDPVRQSEFEFVGKPMEHAQAHAAIAITGYSERQYAAVMRDSFIAPLLAPDPQIGMIRGRQSAYNERINLARTPAAAYGSLFELQRPAGT